MPPSQFFVKAQHGIAGGFRPPQPTEVNVLSRSTDSPTSLQIQSTNLKDASQSLQPSKRDLTDSHSALVDELHGILRNLPTEQPPGSQDIYGMDVGIQWGSDDLEWANGGPEGCSGGFSTVQATDEQRAKFKRAVEIVNKLAKDEV